MSRHGKPAELRHSHKFLTGQLHSGRSFGIYSPPRPGYHADRKAVNKIDILVQACHWQEFHVTQWRGWGQTKNMKLGYFSWPTGFTDAKKLTDR
jgi:hypothetical protein